MDNATTVISSEILRPVWNATRQAPRNNLQVIDITDGIKFIDFKNEFLKSKLYDPLRQQINGFDNLK
jgi:hypothetical protein